MVSIKDRLDRVGALVESLNEQGVIADELERDLALSLLREIYSEIKFGAGPEPKSEPEAEFMAEPEAEKATESAEESVEVPAELPGIPRRIAPEVIRSLYGSDTEPEPLPKPEPETWQEYEPESESEPEPAHNIPTEAPTPKILGETLRTGNRDMAAHLAAAERPSLRRSIGLNDRFLMIRDLFDGDTGAFDRAITHLDAFTDPDEAVIWLRENIDRSADNKGMELLVALLERKLGR